MPNINIDDAYTLNETGAQVDKVTGLFTKDENTTNPEKAFAQLNIGTAGSNRNLLDNPWFTVNQRGQSSYTGRVYGVDRWIEYGTGNTVTVTNNGITLPIDTNSGFEQYFDDTFIQGKTVTISFMTADGTVTSKTVTWPTSGANMTAYSNGVAFFYGTVIGKKGLAILTNAEVTLRAVKLELGSVSTLANDGPPDYWQELDKCLYYFERITNNGSSPITIGAGFADGVNSLYVPVHIHRKRAGIATVSTSGTIYAGQRSSNIVVSSVTKYNSLPDGIITLLAVTPSSFTNNEYYRLALGAGAHIDFSAEP